MITTLEEIFNHCRCYLKMRSMQLQNRENGTFLGLLLGDGKTSTAFYGNKKDAKLR